MVNLETHYNNQLNQLTNEVELVKNKLKQLITDIGGYKAQITQQTLPDKSLNEIQNISTEKESPINQLNTLNDKLVSYYQDLDEKFPISRQSLLEKNALVGEIKKEIEIAEEYIQKLIHTNKELKGTSKLYQ